jgi:hypothetical protein
MKVFKIDIKGKKQWLHDQSQISGDTLSSIRCDTSKHFSNKNREYLKGKINDLAMDSKNKNIRILYRGMNEFNKGYQPRINLEKNENGDLPADS